MACLQTFQDFSFQKLFPLSSERTILGRHFDCDIILNDKTVSRHHAHIPFTHQEYYIEDLNSSNGTYMNEIWLAGYWGLLAGAALLLGAAVGYYAKVPPWLTAAVMAFGSGVLLSALSFELMLEAVRQGGIVAAACGFLLGALIYTLANWGLARAGAKHRKRSGERHPDADNAGTAIAVGALIDGIPESIAIGLSILHGGAVSMATVIAIFLSNIPEGLSSSVGMKRVGRSAAFVFGLWAAIAYASGLAALLGYAVFQNFPAYAIAATTAVAAGGILAMLADTMIPEAFQDTRTAAGLITALGFLAAFALSAAQLG